MTSLSKPKQIQFMNCIVGIHDFACKCSSPALHSAKIILKQLNPDLTEEERNQLKKCLGTTTDRTDAAGDAAGEDLEAVFGEAFDEDDG